MHSKHFKNSVFARTIRYMNTRPQLILLLLCIAALCGCSTPAVHYAYVPLSSLNSLDVYQVKNSSDALTEVLGAPFPVGNGPAAVCVHPSGKFAYTANS